MNPDKMLVGGLYIAAGVLLANGLWLFPQSPERKVGGCVWGCVFIMTGIGVLLGAICAHWEERSDD